MKNKEKYRKLNLQINLIEKVTDKAIKKIHQESKNKERNYIDEWFRYVELVGINLKKHLN